jgi:hypothetical protein
MTALPPKADMFGVEIDVRFVPTADVTPNSANVLQPMPPAAPYENLRCLDLGRVAKFGEFDEPGIGNHPAR